MLLTATAHAHEVKGTMVLAGSVKSVSYVRGVEVKCSMKIEGKGLFGGKGGVQNLLEDDQFGNPAYKVYAEIELKSKDKELLDLKFAEKIVFSNLHASGVNDTLYATLTPKAPAPTPQRPNPVAPAKGSEAQFTIDDLGNIRTLKVQTAVGAVNCIF